MTRTHIIPGTGPTPASIEPRSIEPSGSKRMKRILVLDDDTDFCVFVKRAGELWGYDVTITSVAADFTQAYEQIRPDVIVLDRVMPGTDGIAVIEWLIREKCAAHILIVSGYNPGHAQIANLIAQNEGLSTIAVCSKPVILSELRAAFEAAPLRPES